MSRIPESLIDEIRYKTDIVEYIGRYVPLTQKGKNYWGLCPFHNDNNPSMSVSPDKQIYKCFVCGAGGNVYRFIQDYQKLHFVEAVILLGEALHLDMEEYKFEQPKVDPLKKKQQDIMEEAVQFLEYQLWSNDGKEAQAFLKERGYDDALLKKFRVGYASSERPLTDFMLAKGYDIKDLIDLNLSREQNGQYRDVFFDRVVFPIADRFGHPIAFSARAIEKNHPIKYINSSETPLYTKGLSIYNHHNAYEEARKKDFLVIVEGVTDVLAFHQAGIDNVVAFLGVAVSDTQIQESLKMTQNIILAFDTDQAGQKASYETGLAFTKKQANVSMWYNDTEYDPDELVKNKGPKALQESLDKKIFWLDYLLIYGQKMYSMQSFQGKKQFAEFFLSHLQNVDVLTQDYYLQEIENITALNADILKTYIQQKTEFEVKFPSQDVRKQKISNNGIMHAEMAILKQILHSRQAAYHFRDKLGFLLNQTANDLALILLDEYRRKESISVADLLSKQLNNDVEDLLFTVMESEVFSEYEEQVMDEYILKIHQKLKKEGSKKAQNKVFLEESNDMKKEFLYEKIEQKREGER